MYDASGRYIKGSRNQEQMGNSVSDPHSLNAYSDPGFIIFANPVPGFKIFADLDPGLDFFSRSKVFFT